MNTRERVRRFVRVWVYRYWVRGVVGGSILEGLNRVTHWAAKENERNFVNIQCEHLIKATALMRHTHTHCQHSSKHAKRHPLNQQEVGICLAFIGNARITQIPPQIHDVHASTHTLTYRKTLHCANENNMLKLIMDSGLTFGLFHYRPESAHVCVRVSEV